MPSLKQLEQFKASFKNVGSEAEVMKGRQMPFNDLELPDTDLPVPFPEGMENGPTLDAEEGMLDLGLDLPPESFSNISGGDAVPAGDTVSTEDAGPPDVADDSLADMDIPGQETGDFSFDDLLSMPEVNLPDESPVPEDMGSFEPEIPDIVEDLPPVQPEHSAVPPAAEETDFSGLEFPEIDLTEAMDMGGESSDSAAEESTGSSDSAEDFGSDFDAVPTGDAVPAGNDEAAVLPDDNFADVEAGEPVEDAGENDFEFPAGDFDLAAPPGPEDEGSAPNGDLDTDLSIPDFDMSPEADAGTSSDEGSADGDLAIPDFDISPEMDADTSGAEASPDGDLDSFDAFNPEGDWSPPEEPLDTPDFSAPPPTAEDFGDFSLPGFDDTFGGPGKAAGSGPAGFTPEEVEEIRLSEGDYKQLQETLSAYPLNLRVACEEIIAEQAVAPDLMPALIKLLVRGAPAKETALMAEKILGRPIPVPKGYAKQTGADLEAEQGSFGYIFVRRFLPVLRLVGAIGLVLTCLAYLGWRFIVVPLQAKSLYKQGYAMIQSGEYGQANERFRQASEKHRVKNWYYRYAEAFRDERQYIHAERKYDELLRAYPRDKKGALDYAAMETYYRFNYEKADRIIRNNILDYAVNDRDGLTALAENNMAWGETNPDRYEEARAAYARLMEKYGRQDPYLEGMLLYFIRTDQLTEVLPLQAHFMSNPKKRKITVPTLAELGGYLLDKRFEGSGAYNESPRVPEEYADKIEGIRDILLRAIKADRTYPESYYHLARYYNHFSSPGEERQTLKDALKTFAAAEKETPRRAAYRVDAHRRYAELLINAGEFFPAEEELIRGVRLYEDARARTVLKTGPEFGRLYADLGDLEFFVKNGDMAAALRFYEEGERNGWAPPEIQYRMGAAHYQNEEWEQALQRFFVLVSVMPNNKRLLYALGNTSYLRGNYFAAQGYYNRLMDLLDTERVRFPNLMPGSRPEEQDLAERIMVADNNLGVTLEALTQISGDTKYRSRALEFFSESIRAWDILTRNPETMSRMQPLKDLYGPGINLAYLNVQNLIHSEPNYEQQIFMRIDRDALESSPWEKLIPGNYRLSDQLLPMPVE